MDHDNRLWLGAQRPDLSWDANGCPQSRQFGDVYFSRTDGIAEARHVFLGGNNLPTAWADCCGDVFTIAETGFGTGLNFLVTWRQWAHTRQRPRRLHFVSVEKYPLALASLQRAHAAWPELAGFSEALQAAWPPPLPGLHRLDFADNSICLDFFVGDIEQALQSMQAIPSLRVNAWYLDGFAPARNPDMWTDSLYQGMARLSAAGAGIATFTAAGHVRRGLQKQGFHIEKTAGFGNKREMLRGIFEAQSTAARLPETPWHLPRQQPRRPAGTLVIGAQPRSDAGAVSLRRPADILVIGAGLAGASCAAALARRGLRVTVLEANTVAGGASGNQQGILYTRISPRQSALNSFSLHSYCFALRSYRQLFAGKRLRSGRDGELCGALHFEDHRHDKAALRQTIASLPELATTVDSATAEALSGIPACPAGIHFPGAGWMHPPALCRTWLEHPSIRTVENCGPVQLSQEGDAWIATDENDRSLACCGIVIVSCGHLSHLLQPLQWLPLQAIRGQVTTVTSTGRLQQLATVVCHDGYISPARAGKHCIGASFDSGDMDADIRAGDHAQNVARLGRALPAIAGDLAKTEKPGGRVGFRAASPDYLPLAGPVPDREPFLADYAVLRRNARRVIPHRGSYLPGLYLSTGHGSRGLTSVPLCAELLAAQICEEPWPMETGLARALAPARFLIRGLARNRL